MYSSWHFLKKIVKFIFFYILKLFFLDQHKLETKKGQKDQKNVKMVKIAKEIKKVKKDENNQNNQKLPNWPKWPNWPKKTKKDQTRPKKSKFIDLRVSMMFWIWCGSCQFCNLSYNLQITCITMTSTHQMSTFDFIDCRIIRYQKSSGTSAV